MDIDDNWTQRLSGGEQQRLAIARAILAKPSWLLLDEATAAMDTALEGTVYAMIAKRLPDTTLVSIAHRDTMDDHHARPPDDASRQRMASPWPTSRSPPNSDVGTTRRSPLPNKVG